jgi:hypothetical protein
VAARVAAELEGRGFGHVALARGGLGEISVHWRDHVLYRNRGIFHAPNARRIVRSVTNCLGESPEPS